MNTGTPWIRRALFAFCALPGLLACSTVGQRSTEIRSALAELNQRQILNCFGPPADFAYSDAAAYYIYRWDLRRQTVGFELDLTRPFFCQWVFKFEGGVISMVDVEGRDGYGLRVDAQCVLLATTCFEEGPRADQPHGQALRERPTRHQRSQPTEVLRTPREEKQP